MHACFLSVCGLQDDMTPVGHTPTPPHPSPGLPHPSPWPALQLALGRAAYYTGFLVLPAILFWVGLSTPDLLHGGYLALLVAWFLGHSLLLEPRASMGAIGNNQVCLSSVLSEAVSSFLDISSCKCCLRLCCLSWACHSVKCTFCEQWRLAA